MKGFVCQVAKLNLSLLLADIIQAPDITGCANGLMVVEGFGHANRS